MSRKHPQIKTLPPRAKTGLADGIVIKPSHNPPDDGGFKYNPPNGGLRKPTSPIGFRQRRIIFSRVLFKVLQGFPSSRRFASPLHTGTTFSVHT